MGGRPSSCIFEDSLAFFSSVGQGDDLLLAMPRPLPPVARKQLSGEYDTIVADEGPDRGRGLTNIMGWGQLQLLEQLFNGVRMPEEPTRHKSQKGVVWKAKFSKKIQRDTHLGQRRKEEAGNLKLSWKK